MVQAKLLGVALGALVARLTSRAEELLPRARRLDRVRDPAVEPRPCRPPAPRLRRPVAGRLREARAEIQVVNYGCPGNRRRRSWPAAALLARRQEAQCATFRGNAARAALAFLRAHPGQVSPITITLWRQRHQRGRRRLQGQPDTASRPARRPRSAQFSTRLSAILEPTHARRRRRRRSCVTGLYNFNADDLRHTDPIFQSLNGTIANVARRYGAHYANLFAAFNPQGSAARERARICAYTSICSRRRTPSDERRLPGDRGRGLEGRPLLIRAVLGQPGFRDPLLRLRQPRLGDEILEFLLA